MVGVGSPTELHGSRTSFIHGVVTVPPKDRILAGAEKDIQRIMLIYQYENNHMQVLGRSGSLN